MQDIQIFDALNAPWTPAGEKGVYSKTFRADDLSGDYFGLVKLDPLTRTGLHQHLGVAGAFILQGDMIDQDDTAGPLDTVYNVGGLIHEAVTYEGLTLVSRNRGRTIYAEQGSALFPESGPLKGAFDKALAETAATYVMPAADALGGACSSSFVSSEKILFDGRGLGNLAPPHVCLLAAFKAGVEKELCVEALLEGFVLGGELGLAAKDEDARRVPGGAAFVIAPGSVFALTCPYGARIVLWSEGVVRSTERPEDRLFGF